MAPHLLKSFVLVSSDYNYSPNMSDDLLEVCRGLMWKILFFTENANNFFFGGSVDFILFYGI